MAKKSRLLFVGNLNSTRGQMAEGFARYYGGNRVDAHSAGIKPLPINPYAQWAMNEAGIDISSQESNALDGLNLTSFDYVVTLCKEAQERCADLPSSVKSEHWEIVDPARARGKPLEVIQAFRLVRNDVERRVKALLTTIFEGQN